MPTPCSAVLPDLPSCLVSDHDCRQCSNNPSCRICTRPDHLGASACRVDRDARRWHLPACTRLPLVDHGPFPTGKIPGCNGASEATGQSRPLFPVSQSHLRLRFVRDCGGHPDGGATGLASTFSSDYPVANLAFAQRVVRSRSKIWG